MKKTLISTSLRAIFSLASIASLTIVAASSAHAVEVLAIGSLNGNLHDLSTQTAGPLENGLAGNLLGGLGSGFAWAGGNSFIATPDRGPNATSYNPLVDDTSSYINRFQTIKMGLQANQAGSPFAFSLTPTLTATTLLSSSTALSYGTGALGTGSMNNTAYTLGSGVPSLNAVNRTNYFTGRSDNFNAALGSNNPNNGRFDPEGVRVSNDGKSVFISDEYGPYVYQFDRATGQRIRSIELPANLAISRLSARGDLEISGNTSGRIANKGMEGLAITPDGKTLVGIMQAPLAQDSNKNVRIVTIEIATGVTHEYAYKLSTGSGVSEILALNDHQFLVDERDGKGLGDGSVASAKHIYKIDLTNAQDVTNLKGDLSSKAVSKTLFVDLVAKLGEKGISAAQVPAKIEGMAFGQDVQYKGVNLHTLYIANDNDFVANVAGHNQFFVLGVSDADLAKVGATYQAQNLPAVPEPETYAMLGLGLLCLGLRRRSAK